MSLGCLPSHGKRDSRSAVSPLHFPSYLAGQRNFNNPSLQYMHIYVVAIFMKLGSRSGIGPGTAIAIRSGVQHVHMLWQCLSGFMGLL